MDTNKKGDIAIFKVLLLAAEKGLIVSKPLSDHIRYDLILDDGRTLKRTQVKYANGKSSYAEGVVRVGLEKCYKGKTLLYDKDVDFMLVYIPKIDKICGFSQEYFANKRNLYIRYEPTKNKQQQGCLMAEDYLW